MACQECLCADSHILTLEHVSARIVPEHVYAIPILFILYLRPRNINCQMFRHLGLGISSHHIMIRQEQGRESCELSSVWLIVERLIKIERKV